MNYWKDRDVPKYVRSENSGPVELDAFAKPISRDASRFIALSGPSSAQDIAAALGATSLSVHRAMVRLEELGIVKGTPDIDNRNGRRVTWSIDLEKADQATRALAAFITGK